MCSAGRHSKADDLFKPTASTPVHISTSNPCTYYLTLLVLLNRECHGNTHNEKYSRSAVERQIVCTGMTWHGIYVNTDLHTETDSGSQSGSCKEKKNKEKDRKDKCCIAKQTVTHSHTFVIHTL